MKNHVLPWRNTSFQLVYLYLCYTGLIYELASIYWVLTLGPKFKVTEDPLHPNTLPSSTFLNFPLKVTFRDSSSEKEEAPPDSEVHLDIPMRTGILLRPWDLGWCWPSNSFPSFKVWFKSVLCHDLPVHTAFWQVRVISFINYFVELFIILITCYRVMETTVLHV